MDNADHFTVIMTAIIATVAVITALSIGFDGQYRQSLQQEQFISCMSGDEESCSDCIGTRKEAGAKEACLRKYMVLKGGK